MKKILPLLLGSLAFSTLAYAEDDFLIMDDDVDTIRVQKDSGRKFKMPKRTSFFSGMEYAEGVSDTKPRNENVKFVVADGSTRLHANFRLRYALSQSESTSGDLQYTSARRTNIVIAPRYEQWVNNNFSFFAEPVYVHQSRPDNGSTKEIKLRPGAQFTFGKHYLTATYTHSFKETERFEGTEMLDYDETDTFEVVSNYTYRMGSNLNFGMSFTRAGNVDNSEVTNRRRSFTIKPSIRFKHWKGMISEINFPYNFNEANRDWSGTESWKVNFNNNYPFSRNMKIVANVGYEYMEYHSGGRYTDDSKDAISAKLGFNFSF